MFAATKSKLTLFRCSEYPSDVCLLPMYHYQDNFQQKSTYQRRNLQRGLLLLAQGLHESSTNFAQTLYMDQTVLSRRPSIETACYMPLLATIETFGSLLHLHITQQIAFTIKNDRPHWSEAEIIFINTAAMCTLHPHSSRISLN